MIKEKLTFLSDTSNYISIPESTIKSVLISDEEKSRIITSLKLNLHKNKNIVSSSLDNHLDDNFSQFDFCNLSDYPLPAVYNTLTSRPLVNLSIFGRRDISNISGQDLVSLMVYSYLVAFYTKYQVHHKFSDLMADFMSGLFIKIFAKKYGLIGSYVDEIPKLRFLVSLYTNISFFDFPEKFAYSRASAISKTNIDKFSIDLKSYDFHDSRQFIKCLSESQVLHGLSLYEFVSIMIKNFGYVSLPIFEDAMRFLATIGATSVGQTTLFPIVLQKILPDLYSKILVLLKDSVR